MIDDLKFKRLDAKHRDVFWVLLVLAVWEETEIEWREGTRILKPGQLRVSWNHIFDMSASDVTYELVRGILRRLEQQGFIKKKRRTASRGPYSKSVTSKIGS